MYLVYDTAVGPAVSLQQAPSCMTPVIMVLEHGKCSLSQSPVWVVSNPAITQTKLDKTKSGYRLRAITITCNCNKFKPVAATKNCGVLRAAVNICVRSFVSEYRKCRITNTDNR